MSTRDSRKKKSRNPILIFAKLQLLSTQVSCRKISLGLGN